ncbi:cAMP-dependent protein kinase type II regulatory subunit isoform X3 [Nematostella vectensis]|uniref:cAMP-dependent protein kinase type II regulatory subunit isoform X3 n=1 Tax=Nematostella vectensis TaxID=45351 RepID=UPI0020777CB7|nr:cAMP-dependent protein kinase type II regulatory subunit isoform X3 [Nematostella vectensis]
MNLEIPSGLSDLLQDFTVHVLREKPEDIVDFAANYFMKLKLKEKRSQKGKKKNKEKGVSFGPPGNDEDDTYNEDEDDEMPEPPKNRYARRQSVCAEPFHPDSEDEGDEQPIVYPKTDEQRQRLNDAIKNILLFKNLAKEQLNEVLDAMFERKTQAGDHIIDQGDDGDNFYVIDRGQYDIYVRIDGQEKMVGSYDNKGSFGELALMYNTPRAATIVSTSEGVIWGLEYERMNLADALVSRQFKDGECIIKQGDEADFMYFVESGTVSIRMHNKSDPTTEVEIAQCTKGGYFGELALITHNTRAASVYSVGDCVCASLDVHAFERLLGPCMDIMKRNIDGYEEQLQKLGVEHTELR